MTSIPSGCQKRRLTRRSFQTFRPFASTVWFLDNDGLLTTLGTHELRRLGGRPRLFHCYFQAGPSVRDSPRPYHLPCPVCNCNAYLDMERYIPQEFLSSDGLESFCPIREVSAAPGRLAMMIFSHFLG